MNSTLAVGGQHLRLALQSVARPDFDDLDSAGFHGANSSVLPCLPRPRLTLWDAAGTNAPP